MSKAPIKLGILISGRGSNMLAILNNIESGSLNATATIVISNNPNAKGIELAKEKGIPTKIIQPKTYKDKSCYEKEIAKTLKENNVDLVILAGYMKIIGADIIDAFPNKIMNIHPSLLPSFKGLGAQKQAFDYGVRFSGCTVHFVDCSLDGGPIIIQTVVPVLKADTPDTLSAKILKEEHQLFSKAITLYHDDKLKINGQKVEIKE